MLNVISKPVRTGLPVGLPCLFVLQQSLTTLRRSRAVDRPAVEEAGAGRRRRRRWRGRRGWKRACNVDRNGLGLENDGGRFELIAAVGLVDRQIGEFRDTLLRVQRRRSA